MSTQITKSEGTFKMKRMVLHWISKTLLMRISISLFRDKGLINKQIKIRLLN